MKNTRKNFRLSAAAAAWLAQIAQQEAASENSMIERLIRAEAKRRKLPPPQETKR